MPDPGTEPLNYSVTITLDVTGIDPTVTDAIDVAEYLLQLYDRERTAGRAPFLLAENSLEAEWTDA